MHYVIVSGAADSYELAGLVGVDLTGVVERGDGKLMGFGFFAGGKVSIWFSSVRVILGGSEVMTCVRLVERWFF